MDYILYIILYIFLTSFVISGTTLFDEINNFTKRYILCVMSGWFMVPLLICVCFGRVLEYLKRLR